MLRAKKRIIVLSEQLLKYRFRALVDGVDLSQYEKNPIMLWMHIRAFGDRKSAYLPIGNVIELKVEVIEGVGKCITGQPMFSEVYDFAKEIYALFEEGTIRMASAGLVPVEWSEDLNLLLPGQTGATLIKSILEEISIVDIGADNNALSIALYNENHELIQLSMNGENAAIPLIKHPQIETEMNKIELTAAKAAALLGKQEIATADQFETEIMAVVQLAHNQKTQIETLTREKQDLQTKIDNADKEALKTDTNVMLAAAENDRKITKDEMSFFEGQITDRASFDKVKLYLDGKGGSPSVQSVINLNSNQQTGVYAGKSWDDLDKAGKLVQLKADDLNLFKTLYKAQFNKEYGA